MLGRLLEMLVSQPHFPVRDGILCEETWYGNIQKILSLDLSRNTGSTIFFSVKWYSMDKVNEQVFFGEIPFSVSRVHSPHLWVFSDVSSSQVIADHLMHNPQEELEIDINL